MQKIIHIYKTLLKAYGYQGWWPIGELKGLNGYHPLDYSIPKNHEQQFEIILGSVLAQSVNWASAEKAIENLKKEINFTPKKLLSLPDGKLKKAIRPAGYFNQKAGYLKNIALFIQNLKRKTPTREELLKVKGIGKETADSILLYAYKVPSFVVDAYLRRIFCHLNLIRGNETYDEIRLFVEKSLPKDYKIYQEFHALLVEHAKRCYRKKPYADKLLQQ